MPSWLLLDMRAQGRTAGAIAAELAGRAHGVVTRARLAEAGVTRAEIETLLRNSALIRVHRGVFRVGHLAPSDRARYLAAVLACGEGAALGGRAAGHLLGLLPRAPAAPGVWTLTERRVPGVRTRRTRDLPATHTRITERIRVTTPARTLVDLATLPVDALMRACHEATVRHGVEPRDVLSVLGDRPNAPGAARVRRIVAGDDPLLLSRLETAFFRRLKAAGLPRPDTNRRIDGHVVDCRWPRHRLTVELDSFAFHNTRLSWQRDRARERAAYARGDQLRRYTWLDVTERPEPMLAELRSLLS